MILMHVKLKIDIMAEIIKAVGENKTYTGGENQSPSRKNCKENDDYFVLWSRKKFKKYFEENIYIEDESDTDIDL